MKMYKLLLISFVVSIAIIACDKDDDEIKETPPENISTEKPTEPKDSTDSPEVTKNPFKYSLIGKIQKGPATKGDTVEIQGLNDSLQEVGAPIKAVIENDDGSYEVSNEQLAELDSTATSARVSFSGKAYNEKTGEVSQVDTISAIISLDTSQVNSDTVNVNTLTDVVADEIQESIEEGSYDGELAETTKEVIQTVLKALEITDPEIIDYYADPTKINLNKDGLLYTLSLVFGDNLKESFLDPYKNINPDDAEIWLSTMIGEGARQLFESMKNYSNYAEENNLELPEIDVTTSSFAGVIKAVLMRDAADGLGSLTICRGDLNISDTASLREIKNSFSELGLSQSDLDSSYFSFYNLNSNDMSTVVDKYMVSDCQADKAIRIKFQLENPDKRKLYGNTVENIQALLKAGAIYAGTHEIGELITE